MSDGVVERAGRIGGAGRLVGLPAVTGLEVEIRKSFRKEKRTMRKDSG